VQRRSPARARRRSKEPREETNPHRKRSGREEYQSMAAFLSIFMKLPLIPRMNEHIVAQRWWPKLILKAFSQRRAVDT
jgi:hypothetical protein